MEQEAPVLIVGAGPVGLSAALCLARHGIKSTLVDRRHGPTDHPKARGITTRTMEIFRLLGVEEAMRKFELPREARRFIWVKRFLGEEIARIDVESIESQGISPTALTLISQNWVEEALHGAVHEEPLIDFRLTTECEDFEDDGHGVAATLRHLPEERRYTMRGCYLIGADGASSMVRESLKLPMQGEDHLGHFCNVYFRADLGPWVSQRPCAAFMFADADLVGRFLLSVDGKERWLLGFYYDPKIGESPQDFTAEVCTELIRETLDLPQIQPEIIRIAFWTMAALIASQFRKGRVLLLGDAAHRLPPTGGLGMNTGIQDAHNVCWKLAAYLKGEADETLLDSYEQERVQAAATGIAFSTENARRFYAIYEALLAGDEEEMTKRILEQSKHLNSVGLDLGLTYDEGAFVPDGTEPPPLDIWHYLPTAHPGRRAPHFALRTEDQELSSLDLFGERFVLLAGEEGSALVETAEGYPMIRAYLAGRDFEDLSGGWRELYGLEESGSCLVRPDGIVAWRCSRQPINAKQELDKALAQVLRPQVA